MTPITAPDEPSQEPSPGFTKPLLAGLAIAVALAGVSRWAIRQLPVHGRIPLHWGIDGRPDGYGSPAALFTMPVIAAGLSLFFFILPRIEPRRSHLRRSARAYTWVWLVMLTFLSGLHVLMVMAALGHRLDMIRWVFGGVGLMLAVIGNFLGKVRSNYFFGIRTPWTLSSELSWNRTHRLSGWLFVLGGVALAGCAVTGFQGKLLLALLVTWLVVSLAISTAYSYFVWRDDPARTAAKSLSSDCES